jgi:hypothetical protein
VLRPAREPAAAKTAQRVQSALGQHHCGHNRRGRAKQHPHRLAPPGTKQSLWVERWVLRRSLPVERWARKRARCEAAVQTPATRCATAKEGVRCQVLVMPQRHCRLNQGPTLVWAHVQAELPQKLTAGFFS